MLTMCMAECLGTVWQAEPIVPGPGPNESAPTLALELLVVSFGARYYSTAQGRKKLKALADDVRRLASVRHTHLLGVLAAKLVLPNASAAPRLYVLHERRPAVTLQDVLEDCESLREDRASVRRSVICS